MQFTLTGSIAEKIGRHNGLYTRSYQEVKASYNARIRNWNIEFKDNLFYVANADKHVEQVYFERDITNCSCTNFLETECGTCMHIEAVRLVYNRPQSKVRPITYINNLFEVTSSNLSAKNCFETPSVKPYLSTQDFKKLPINSDKFEDVDVFKNQGISLFDFQKESIVDMIRNMRSVLTLQMGLGKTLCALACVKLLQKEKHIIVAPNSLKYQWQQEIHRFGLGTTLVASKRQDLALYNGQKFLILSYELFNSNKSLLEHKFDVLIADEIQKIKNQEGQTWKTMSGIKSDYVFALSGTPIQNSITDLISLINFLNPQELKPEWKFLEQYCTCTKARILGIKSDMVDALRKRLARYLINPKVDFTKFKLPSKNEKTIRTSLTNAQKEMHDQYYEPARVLLARSMTSPLSFAEKIALNGLLTKARIAATDLRLIKPDAVKSEKFQKIEEQIERTVKENKKIIVYSEWIKTLDLLLPFLDEKNINYVCFNGKMSAQNRHKFLTSFMQDSDKKVLLSSDAGSVGIDGLQIVCNEIIHIEKIWNPMRIEQRNGRLVRALQPKDVVNIHYFETDSGIEEMISINHGRKHAVIHDMLR